MKLSTNLRQLLENEDPYRSAPTKLVPIETPSKKSNGIVATKVHEKIVPYYANDGHAKATYYELSEPIYHKYIEYMHQQRALENDLALPKDKEPNTTKIVAISHFPNYEKMFQDRHRPTRAYLGADGISVPEGQVYKTDDYLTPTFIKTALQVKNNFSYLLPYEFRDNPEQIYDEMSITPTITQHFPFPKEKLPENIHGNHDALMQHFGFVVNPRLSSSQEKTGFFQSLKNKLKR